MNKDESERLHGGLRYEIGKAAVSLFAAQFFNIRHFGTEHVPEEGGLLLAANHQCFFDPMFVGLGIRRQVHFMARASSLNVPVIRRILRNMNVFPVERGQADTKAYRRAVALLSAGEILLVFPEGTRTHDGKIGEMKSGVISMAQRAGCSIVPVALRGGYDLWPRHQRFPRPGSVRVAVGQPFSSGRGKAPAAEAAERLDREIRRLYDALADRFPNGDSVT